MNQNIHYQQNAHSFQRPQTHTMQQQIPRPPILVKKEEYLESFRDLVSTLERLSKDRRSDLTEENYFEINIKLHEFERCTAVQLEDLSKQKNKRLRQLKKI